MSSASITCMMPMAIAAQTYFFPAATSLASLPAAVSGIGRDLSPPLEEIEERERSHDRAEGKVEQRENGKSDCRNPRPGPKSLQSGANDQVHRRHENRNGSRNDQF